MTHKLRALTGANEALQLKLAPRLFDVVADAKLCSVVLRSINAEDRWRKVGDSSCHQCTKKDRLRQRQLVMLALANMTGLGDETVRQDRCAMERLYERPKSSG